MEIHLELSESLNELPLPHAWPLKCTWPVISLIWTMRVRYKDGKESTVTGKLLIEKRSLNFSVCILTRAGWLSSP